MEPGEGGRDTGHPVLLVYSYACTHKKDCHFCILWKTDWESDCQKRGQRVREGSQCWELILVDSLGKGRYFCAGPQDTALRGWETTTIKQKQQNMNVHTNEQHTTNWISQFRHTVTLHTVVAQNAPRRLNTDTGRARGCVRWNDCHDRMWLGVDVEWL